MMFFCARLIATLGGCGFIPIAPGTMASALTCLILYLLYQMIPLSDGSLIIWCVGGAILMSALLGYYATYVYINQTQSHDPKEVVIDEFLGQSFAVFIFLIYQPYSDTDSITLIDWMILFLSFRFFDITKIWPASHFDRHAHSAFSVMADDVIAGIYAGLTSLAVSYFLRGIDVF